jgi:hypothetical protein
MSSHADDLVISVDGWAGSDGLSGYFGYLGPELEEYLAADSAAPQVSIKGRRMAMAYPRSTATRSGCR